MHVRHQQATNQAATPKELAIQNHIDARGTFPTGGDAPHPKIKNYVTGGDPNGTTRQNGKSFIVAAHQPPPFSSVRENTLS
jgi:hypothetical protein